MAIWREPIFNRTLADVEFAISQIEAWKNSHSHIGDIEVLEEAIKLSVNGDVKLEEDLVKLQAGNSYIQNETLVLQLGTIYDLKGCLNLSDIIRIEDNLKYISEQLNNYHYPIYIYSKEWTLGDLPTADDMMRIVNNIRSIFNEYYTPSGSVNMSGLLLSIGDVNALERNLFSLKQMLDAMVALFASSGTTKCGAGHLPLRR